MLHRDSPQKMEHCLILKQKSVNDSNWNLAGADKIKHIILKKHISKKGTNLCQAQYLYNDLF